MAKYEYRVVVSASTIVEIDEEDEMFAIEQAAPSMDISSGDWKAELISKEGDN